MAETITMTMTQLRELLAAVGVAVGDDAPAGDAVMGLADSGGAVGGHAWGGLAEEAAAYGAAAAKDRRIAARIDDFLYARARAATGIDRDSDLVRAGLEALADPDGFGAWLAGRRGSLPQEFALDL